MILPWVHARGDPTDDDGGVCDAVYDDFCAILCLADARPRLPTRSASLLSALQVQVPLPPKTKSVFSIALPSSKINRTCLSSWQRVCRLACPSRLLRNRHITADSAFRARQAKRPEPFLAVTPLPESHKRHIRAPRRVASKALFAIVKV